MAQFACSCGDGMGKLGLFDCFDVATATQRDIFVQTYDSEGNRNGIPSPTQDPSAWENGKLKESYIISMLDNPDPTKRWNITWKTYNNITPGRTEDKVETTGDDSIFVLSNGVGTFEGQIKKVPTAWTSLITQGSCSDFSTFNIGQGGELSGETSADGTFLYPLRIQKGSLTAKSFAKTNDAEQYVQINYQLSKLADEGSFITLQANSIEADMLNAQSLTGYVLTEVAGSTDTNLLVSATSGKFGQAFNYKALIGATESTDWTVLDGVTPVVVTSVTETSDGNYDLLIPTNPATALTISYLKTRTSATAFGACSDSIVITTP
tara:strand:+ start:7214 stop:8179 length:966 start_codon:yes stop_codon:yes gene_type:complete